MSNLANASGMTASARLQLITAKHVLTSVMHPIITPTSRPPDVQQTREDLRPTDMYDLAMVTVQHKQMLAPGTLTGTVRLIMAIRMAMSPWSAGGKGAAGRLAKAWLGRWLMLMPADHKGISCRRPDTDQAGM